MSARSPRSAWRAVAVAGLALLLPAAAPVPALAASGAGPALAASGAGPSKAAPAPGPAKSAVDVASGAGPARAADSGGYRYWSFWEQDERRGEGGKGGQDAGAAWSYATRGPSVLRPADGAVVGFRFALSENSEDAAKPRGSTEFEDACNDTKAEPGRKRIALRIDFGTAAHALRGETPPKPRTACARVAGDATAADALAEVAKPLRYNSAALLCAIDGYPKRGCGEQASDGGGGTDGGAGGEAGEKAEREEDSGGSLGPTAGVAAGLAAVAALSVAAAYRSRRRR